MNGLLQCYIMVKFSKYSIIEALKYVDFKGKGSLIEVVRIINIWSFMCALMCVVFFFIAFNHPSLLNINFCLAIILFFIGIAGFFGINNGASALRSILTVAISGVLIFVTGFILFTGYLFS
ncbi:hypothetical protein [Priestia megaterium]|uniref:hypothetical protein n=1 Tax=Priestia megaterium TaxID=1404 RepID=UPI002E1E3982|nr:hypothetical protein [Priestia megaterium]